MSRVPATNVAAFWDEMARPGPAWATVGGVELGRGSRVRLAPKAGGDVLDLVLAGRVAVVEGLETDPEGAVQLAVRLEDDPGRDLGEGQYSAHRFYFALDQVEPLAAGPSIDGPAAAAGPAPAAAPRILVAGIGNVFLGDDGFGVAVAARLAERSPAVAGRPGHGWRRAPAP